MTERSERKREREREKKKEKMKEKKKEKKRERERERKRERLNDGDNNGQATHGARKHAWRTQAAWAKKKLFSIISYSQRKNQDQY